MAVLGECPFCHRKQAVKNRVCPCGEDLVQLKRSKKIRYWISYRLPGGKQRREAVGYSIEEARDAEGKRRGQKRENRIFDIKPEAKMTFSELTEWFLELEKVKTLNYYPTLKINLKKFNSEFGNVIVSRIKPVDLENYQAKRKATGRSDSTIDQEIAAARNMINKAFDNDIVGGDTLKTFKRVKNLLRGNANARDKILPLDQFRRLVAHLPWHAKGILATAFYTGMRRGEIVSLTWDKVDLKNRMIQLEASDTKDKEPRTIPICDELYEILNRIPKPLHRGYVFLYKGKPIKGINRTLRRACRMAGIPYGRFVKDGFVFHDLRHTFNTYMRKAGVPESVIMTVTGHSTREMFDRYNTVDTDDAKQAINQFRNYLLESVDQNVDQLPNEKEKEASPNLPTS
jgi:integrase